MFFFHYYAGFSSRKELTGFRGVSTQKKHAMAGHHMKMNLVRMS